MEDPLGKVSPLVVEQFPQHIDVEQLRGSLVVNQLNERERSLHGLTRSQGFTTDQMLYNTLPTICPQRTSHTAQHSTRSTANTHLAILTTNTNLARNHPRRPPAPSPQPIIPHPPPTNLNQQPASHHPPAATNHHTPDKTSGQDDPMSQPRGSSPAALFFSAGGAPCCAPLLPYPYSRCTLSRTEGSARNIPASGPTQFFWKPSEEKGGGVEGGGGQDCGVGGEEEVGGEVVVEDGTVGGR